jgi:hypothetical protein
MSADESKMASEVFERRHVTVQSDCRETIRNAYRVQDKKIEKWLAALWYCPRVSVYSSCTVRVA